MPLQPSARKVQEALAAAGFSNPVVELPDSARSAAEAAAAVGCDVAQIVKSLVFRGRDTGRAVLVVASGGHRVDEQRVAAVVGEAIEKASAEFVRERTGFAIGGTRTPRWPWWTRRSSRTSGSGRPPATRGRSSPSRRPSWCG
jgi:prolyl-tRNA editing enzyme YbaK/EbsC (Cys-tRNA(Pro) deacylase)